MNFPSPEDFIDIHNHGGIPGPGRFTVENLMAHEDRVPDNRSGIAYTYGIHPWHVTSESSRHQLEKVGKFAHSDNVIALGEAGFDRLRGPDQDLQREVFTDQVKISSDAGKPLFIHCVKAWDELLEVHKMMNPARPWIIHGFRGKRELALQLISKGMYISFWFDFIIRPESEGLVKSVPAERIFLETDGSDVPIVSIYEKVAHDLGITNAGLKEQIHNNYSGLFGRSHNNI